MSRHTFQVLVTGCYSWGHSPPALTSNFSGRLNLLYSQTAERQGVEDVCGRDRMSKSPVRLIGAQSASLGVCTE